MTQEPSDTSKSILDRILPRKNREKILDHWLELAATVLLALATVATAWSGYQSTLWGGKQTDHSSAATVAIIRTSKYANLAEQKLTLHADLFSQWLGARGANNQPLADFMQRRFPEPLKTAAIAWQATQPLTDPTAPTTPFAMAEYVLPETLEMQHWEAVSEAEFQAAAEAGIIADRYLLFTIIFASVLFFGGVTGKFDAEALNWAVLALGAIGLLLGLAILLSTPIL
ncbi:MAG: hypothetical protein IT331_02480 [Anaerolineae bacterium]|nr:hypothetical protein [Anaerolineae bacterium]